MKLETIILTDNQMTNLIYYRVKGDLRHKDLVKNDWLTFSYKTWQDDLHVNIFIKKINAWLEHHKLPIQVLNFTRFDEESDNSESVEWEVQISSHD